MSNPNEALCIPASTLIHQLCQESVVFGGLPVLYPVFHALKTKRQSPERSVSHERIKIVSVIDYSEWKNFYVLVHQNIFSHFSVFPIRQYE